ncbi:MAG TPA: zf-HC2 domain-containing protein, partial [Rugosimonospora sp.]|nr:zf-HC2 domain-containing protein [Rugosimonospora sp.]
MTCEEVRFAMSASLDGEEPGQPAGVVEAHLSGCAACAVWQEEALRLTRMVRVQAARVPDLHESIMAAVAVQADRPQPRERRAA